MILASVVLSRYTRVTDDDRRHITTKAELCNATASCNIQLKTPQYFQETWHRARGGYRKVKTVMNKALSYQNIVYVDKVLRTLAKRSAPWTRAGQLAVATELSR